MADTKPIHELVAQNFGPVAASYASSPGHANKDTLAELVELIGPSQTDEALDIATGAGNVALAFAPYVKRVVAYDLTPAMLEQTRKTATERGIENLETVQGLAENLPFEDGSFDIVMVRLAPHHYVDIVKAIQEMARVTRTGGKVLIVDTTAPENDDLDRQTNEIEKLRDNSHVRNYKPSEWLKMVQGAGLTVQYERINFYTEGFEMDFDVWVQRIRTPEAEVAELRRRLHAASPELAAELRLRIDGDKIGFALAQLTLIAAKL